MIILFYHKEVFFHIPFQITQNFVQSPHKGVKIAQNDNINDKSFKSMAKRLKAQNRGSAVLHLQKLYNKIKER